MIKCKLCGKYFKIITNTHLISAHNCSLKTYIQKFGAKGCGFLSPNLLPKNDPRYKKWRESLKKRPPSWSRGYTKYNNSSVAKISRTFKKKKIDNFARWRKEMKRLGKIKSSYPRIKHNGDLAELIGVVSGDGHIRKFPRTESLSIFSNSNNPGFIKRYAKLVEKLFDKKASLTQHGIGVNCIRIRIYQKEISRRLKIISGSRKEQNIKIPRWILENKNYIKRYLRGLYEAEGSFCIHKPTYTYKFLFRNANGSLLNNVYRALKILGFHPHRSKNMIQVSRKQEVYEIKDLIDFRQY